MKMRKLTNAEVKSIELDILNYIDKICSDNNICYYLDYGTLLGAVRHKGFIPWDDDIDICMERTEYNRFIEVMKKMENERFRLLSHETDPEYYYEFGKVVDTRTKLIETDLLDNPNMGVWVDVFPKDKIPRRSWFWKKITFLLVVCRVFSVYKKFPGHRNKLFYPVWLLSKAIGYNRFLDLIERISIRWIDDGDAKYIADLRDLTAKETIWDTYIWGEGEYVEFEGKKYRAPQKWDDYLRGLYDDYMTLPDEDKRVSHKFDVYWK